MAMDGEEVCICVCVCVCVCGGGQFELTSSMRHCSHCLVPSSFSEDPASKVKGLMDFSAMSSAICTDSSRWMSFAANSEACVSFTLPWTVGLGTGDGRKKRREGGEEEERRKDDRKKWEELGGGAKY